MSDRLSILDLKKMKKEKKPITMITAYDFPTAEIVDEAGIDTILVGDSLGMVVLGYPDTLSVTLGDMIHHAKAVIRGSKRALVIIDMPFLTYQVTPEDALRNAGKAIQESGAQAVKVEGGLEILEAVKKITSAGIPVVGHLGLTPQSAGQLGGFKVQGKDPEVAKKMYEDARALEKAGIFMLVLECVPQQLAKYISDNLNIPVVGIGAGIDCDGQVLVYHDIIGLFSGKRPKFVKQYIDAREFMQNGVKEYIQEIREKTFPDETHAFNMPEENLDKIVKNS